ncbi:MAG: hypothetical protein Q9191_004741 [Dirinaria sp. TL-2023a]
MPLPTHFQLAVELTNSFPAREIAGQAYHRVLGFARDLKRSGSDLVVEEDLAATFGRGQVNKEVEKRFKAAVLRNTHLHPLYRNSEVGLDTRAGPTLNRAITDPDRYYMSTVIQLSLLGWVHGRNGLASTLAECMNKRFEMQLPEARPTPGYEGIFGMLEACSSQTSDFNWSNYLMSVEARLGPGCINNDRRSVYLRLKPETLLATMDYFYITQKFPEDRQIIFGHYEGILTIITWAYHVLDLTVLVKGAPGGDVIFGKRIHFPQVIIVWSPYQDEQWQEVCLLDKNSEVVLRTEKDEMTFTCLEARERLPLQNYGTILLHREFNRYVSVLKNEPVHTDAAQMIVAMAIVDSRKLLRTAPYENVTFSPLRIERWRIINFAGIIFQDLTLDIRAVDAFADVLINDEDYARGGPLPRSLELHLEKTKRWTQGIPSSCLGLLRRLARLTLVFSNVAGVEDSANLPLIADLSHLDWFASPNLSFDSSDAVPESKFLNLAASILLGNRSFHQINKTDSSIDDRTFLVSDYGWSVFVSAVGDVDPASIHPELLYLKKGVPTKLRTGERRSVIRDADRDLFSSDQMSLTPTLAVADRGRSYNPRSIYRFKQRAEYYAVLKDSFQLNIRFSGEELRPIKDTDEAVRARNDGAARAFFELPLEESLASSSSTGERWQSFTYTVSYRQLHRCLWDMIYTPPCSHSIGAPKGTPTPTSHQTRLGLGIATGNIFGWVDEQDEEPGRPEVGAPERIIILLVKDDRLARWLAVAEAASSRARRTMLRTQECCEDCALDAVNQFPGKWFLII